MGVFGALICIAEIIIGVIVLLNNQGQPVFIGTGIGYILSGLLFIWLCGGASTAFINEKRVKQLKEEVEKLKEQEDVYNALFRKLNISQEEIDRLSQASFSRMQEGHPLISLAEKTLASSNTIIPKGTSLSFVRIEQTESNEKNVIANVIVDGENHLVRYKECDVISAYLLSEDNLR